MEWRLLKCSNNYFCSKLSVLDSRNYVSRSEYPFIWFSSERRGNTVKPVYNDHPRDPKIVDVVDRWLLFGGSLCYNRSNWVLKTVAVVDRWSLFGGGRLLRFDCICMSQSTLHDANRDCLIKVFTFFHGNEQITRRFKLRIGGVTAVS